MNITSLTLTNFRCFEQKTFSFDAPFVCIEGPNGSGKSSLIEALHYGCYLKSPRTSSAREMIALERDAFCIELNGALQEETWNLVVGCSGNRKRIKLNNTPITSFKELYPFYKAITMSENDIALIQGAPEVRRTFLDTALILNNPAYGALLKKYKTIVEQRNALLANGRRDTDSYAIWSEQLFVATEEIHRERTAFLHLLHAAVARVWESHFSHTPSLVPLSWEYSTRKYTMTDTFESFTEENKFLLQQEWKYGHSLYGAHTDDIIMKFEDRASRSFASRGQQKLLVLLIKMAQFMLLQKQAVLLLDDFMSDFDNQRIAMIIELLSSLNTQIFLTCPSGTQPPLGNTISFQNIILS